MPPQTVTCLVDRGFVESDGRCACPIGYENERGYCKRKESLCVQAKPRFTMAESTAAGAVSILKAEFNGSASLPTGTAVSLAAVPQKAAVAVPLSLQSSGSALLPTTGTWLLKLSIGNEECTGLLEPTVTCLPTFVPTPSGGCACPPGQENKSGKCAQTDAIERKTACAVAIFTPIERLTDSTKPNISFSDNRSDANVTVILRPKVNVRDAAASDL